MINLKALQGAGSSGLHKLLRIERDLIRLEACEFVFSS